MIRFVYKLHTDGSRSSGSSGGSYRRRYGRYSVTEELYDEDSYSSSMGGGSSSIFHSGAASSSEINQLAKLLFSNLYDAPSVPGTSSNGQNGGGPHGGETWEHDGNGLDENRGQSTVDVHSSQQKDPCDVPLGRAVALYEPRHVVSASAPKASAQSVVEPSAGEDEMDNMDDIVSALAAFVGVDDDDHHHHHDHDEQTQTPPTLSPSTSPSRPQQQAVSRAAPRSPSGRVTCVTTCALANGHNVLACAVQVPDLSAAKSTIELFDSVRSTPLGWVPWKGRAPVVAMAADASALLIATRDGGLYTLKLDEIVRSTNPAAPPATMVELWEPCDDAAPIAACLWWQASASGVRQPIVACRDGTVHLPAIDATLNGKRRQRSVSIAVSTRSVLGTMELVSEASGAFLLISETCFKTPNGTLLRSGGAPFHALDLEYTGRDGRHHSILDEATDAFAPRELDGGEYGTAGAAETTSALSAHAVRRKMITYVCRMDVETWDTHWYDSMRPDHALFKVNVPEHTVDILFSESILFAICEAGVDLQGHMLDDYEPSTPIAIRRTYSPDGPRFVLSALGVHSKVTLHSSDVPRGCACRLLECERLPSSSSSSLSSLANGCDSSSSSSSSLPIALAWGPGGAVAFDNHVKPEHVFVRILADAVPTLGFAAAADVAEAFAIALRLDVLELFQLVGMEWLHHNCQFGAGRFERSLVDVAHCFLRGSMDRGRATLELLKAGMRADSAIDEVYGVADPSACRKDATLADAVKVHSLCLDVVQDSNASSASRMAAHALAERVVAWARAPSLKDEGGSAIAEMEDFRILRSLTEASAAIRQMRRRCVGSRDGDGDVDADADASANVPSNFGHADTLTKVEERVARLPSEDLSIALRGQAFDPKWALGLALMRGSHAAAAAVYASVGAWRHELACLSMRGDLRELEDALMRIGVARGRLSLEESVDRTRTLVALWPRSGWERLEEVLLGRFWNAGNESVVRALAFECGELLFSSAFWWRIGEQCMLSNGTTTIHKQL